MTRSITGGVVGAPPPQHRSAPPARHTEVYDDPLEDGEMHPYELSRFMHMHSHSTIAKENVLTSYDPVINQPQALLREIRDSPMEISAASGKWLWPRLFMAPPNSSPRSAPVPNNYDIRDRISTDHFGIEMMMAALQSWADQSPTQPPVTPPAYNVMIGQVRRRR